MSKQNVWIIAALSALILSSTVFLASVMVGCHNTAPTQPTQTKQQTVTNSETVNLTTGVSHPQETTSDTVTTAQASFPAVEPSVEMTTHATATEVTEPVTATSAATEVTEPVTATSAATEETESVTATSAATEETESVTATSAATEETESVTATSAATEETESVTATSAATEETESVTATDTASEPTETIPDPAETTVTEDKTPQLGQDGYYNNVIKP